MIQYEEKFLVINWKHIKNIPQEKAERFRDAVIAIEEYLPDNKYYVCNQDEPYAEKVLETILSGEKEKLI